MLLATALALLIGEDVLNRLPHTKQTGSAVAFKGNYHLSFLRCFWNWAEENWVDAAKICGGAENTVKTETQQHS